MTGLGSEGERVYSVVDGSELRMSISVGRVDFMGEFVGATIVKGEDESEPLLGVTALKAAEIEVAWRNQELRR